MTEVKHTPTPWVAEVCRITCSYGVEIAFLSTDNRTFKEDEANTAHIVKCVNMHDELVDFSKDLYTSIMAVGGIALIDHLKPEIEGLKQVLKKAGAL